MGYMLLRKNILAMCCFLCFSCLCMGQEIKGTVVAADGKGVPFATVMLLKSDSSFCGRHDDRSGRSVFNHRLIATK
jgi:hypothetical protein